MNEISSDIAKFIRTLRKKLNLSQIELARRLDVAPLTVSNWEKGRRFPSYRSLKKLAKLMEEVEDMIEIEFSPELIRSLRHKMGLSTEEFARSLGVSYDTISRLERGVSSPSYRSRRKLATLFLTSYKEEKEIIPSLIRFLRSKLGLTQEELARKLGISRFTVNRWEKGRTPSRRLARKLANFLKEESDEV